MTANNQTHPGGRPRTAAPTLPIYDSMQACSNATGIPLSALKTAKHSGCSAFRSNRVDLGLLLPWLFSQNGEDSGLNWNEELAKEKAKRERIKRMKEEKLVADKGVVREGLQSVAALYFGHLARCERELPPDLKGRTELEISSRIVRFNEETRVRLKEEFQKLAEGEE